MKGLIRYDEQSDADQALVDLVRRKKDEANPYHQRWRGIAERRYAMYRSYQDFKGLPQGLGQ